MKKIIFLFCLLFCKLGFAQSNIPNSVNFQSIARDGLGNLVTNTNIEVQFTILDGGPTGTPLRQPRFIRNTDQYGQFSLTLSEDSATSFGPSGATPIPNIDWASGNKWIKIEFRPNLISPYTLIETIRCNSTFYAFAAKSAEKINIAGVNGQVLKHNGTTWVAGVDVGQSYTAGSGIDINGSNIIATKPEYAIYEERYAYPGTYSPFVYGLGNPVAGGLSSSIQPGTWTGTTGNHPITGYIPLTEQVPSNTPSISYNPANGIITLAAGTYRIKSYTNNDVDAGVGYIAFMKSRIINTASVMIAEGSTPSVYASTCLAYTTASSVIDQVVVIPPGGTTIKFQRYVGCLNGSSGAVSLPFVVSYGIVMFGIPNQDVILSQLMIEKIK